MNRFVWQRVFLEVLERVCLENLKRKKQELAGKKTSH
jgi:hypothetical protein